MITLARIGVLIDCLLLPCVSANAQASDNTQPLYLLGRSEVQGYYQVDLSANDWMWLRNQRQLVLGITPRGVAPFELNTDGGDYEGLIADYAKLLGELLKIRIDVRLFASREEAITALSLGRADLLAIGHYTEEGDTSLSLSRAYAGDSQVLVSRESADALSSSDLAGKRIAAAEFYWMPQELESLYPKASIQMYPSVQTAVGAVAFNRADVYLGEAITASYLINKNYPNDLQLAQMSISHGGHFAFVLSSQDKRLLRMVNSALEAIPLAERLVILRRWSAGAEGLPGQYFSLTALRPTSAAD